MDIGVGNTSDTTSGGITVMIGDSDNHVSSFNDKSSGSDSVTISSVTITWQFGSQTGHSIGVFFTEVA